MYTKGSIRIQLYINSFGPQKYNKSSKGKNLKLKWQNCNTEKLTKQTKWKNWVSQFAI